MPNACPGLNSKPNLPEPEPGTNTGNGSGTHVVNEAHAAIHVELELLANLRAHILGSRPAHIPGTSCTCHSQSAGQTYRDEVEAMLV